MSLTKLKSEKVSRNFAILNCYSDEHEQGCVHNPERLVLRCLIHGCPKTASWMKDLAKQLQNVL